MKHSTAKAEWLDPTERQNPTGTGDFVVTAITVVADVGVQLLSSYVAGLQGPTEAEKK